MIVSALGRRVATMLLVSNQLLIVCFSYSLSCAQSFTSTCSHFVFSILPTFEPAKYCQCHHSPYFSDFFYCSTFPYNLQCCQTLSLLFDDGTIICYSYAYLTY